MKRKGCPRGNKGAGFSIVPALNDTGSQRYKGSHVQVVGPKGDAIAWAS